MSLFVSDREVGVPAVPMRPAAAMARSPDAMATVVPDAMPLTVVVRCEAMVSAPAAVTGPVMPMLLFDVSEMAWAARVVTSKAPF